MDPTEITRHIPEVVSVAKVAVASIPFTAIVKRMLGDASDEVAKQLADEIKVYRYGRSLKLLQKAEKMAQEAGFTPKAVPIKLLFPLLEGASLEEDENLHDMWAALLANAASPDNAAKVRPGFIASLKEMSPNQSSLLDWMSEASKTHVTSLVDPTKFTKPIAAEELAVCLDSLEAAQLIRRSDLEMVQLTSTIRKMDSSRSSVPILPSMLQSPSRADIFARRVNKTYLVTDRGLAFIDVVTAPKPKS